MKNSKSSGASSLVSKAQQKVTTYAIGGLANHSMVPQDMKAEGMANLNNKVEAGKTIKNSQQNQMH